MKINNDFNALSSKANHKKSETELSGFEEALRIAAKNKDKKALKKAADGLEKIFISMMFKSMRKSVMESNLMQKSIQRDIFSDMLDDQYAEEMSKTSSFGLSDMIVKQYEKIIDAYETEK